jgi:hypothetical protein
VCVCGGGGGVAKEEGSRRQGRGREGYAADVRRNSPYVEQSGTASLTCSHPHARFLYSPSYPPTAPPLPPPLPRAPLAQLQARVALRGQRPDGELVEDGVEAALTAEALALHAATTSLASKLAAVEEAIAALDANAAALAANLEDKEVAAELEGRVAALDGRRSPGVPRTPSMLSVSGGGGGGEAAWQWGGGDNTQHMLLPTPPEAGGVPVAPGTGPANPRFTAG